MNRPAKLYLAASNKKITINSDVAKDPTVKKDTLRLVEGIRKV